MTFTVRSQVHRDIAEAIQYYLGEESPQSAERFADEVDVAYDEIIADPTRPRTIEFGFREKKLKKFPYSVLYSIEESEIVVVAVYHDERDRTKLRDRI